MIVEPTHDLFLEPNHILLLLKLNLVLLLALAAVSRTSTTDAEGYLAHNF